MEEKEMPSNLRSSGPPPQLVQLHSLVGGVAGEEEVVPRGHSPRETHEERGVDAHG